MKFKLECDEMDGLILIDKSYLSELDDEMLYSFDILLDIYGESELIYDFPNEEWNTVRARETKALKEFCNSGKMIIWLLNDTEKECEFEAINEISAPSKWLHAPTGKLLAVTAGELTQCLSYPELDIEKLFELDVEQGWYAISDEGTDRITYCKKEPKDLHIDNIQELCDEM